MNNNIEISQLTKTYKSGNVLNNVTFTTQQAIESNGIIEYGVAMNLLTVD